MPISVTRTSGDIGSYPVTLLLVPQGSGMWYAISQALFNHHMWFMPLVLRLAVAGVDAYEPDNTCTQHSQLSGIQSCTYFNGTPGADTDVMRAVLADGTQPVTYFLRFRGTGAGTQPRLVIFYTCQTCSVGTSVTYTSTGGSHVVVPLQLAASSVPYTYTEWISTNATGAWGTGETYKVSLSTASLLSVSGSGVEMYPPSSKQEYSADVKPIFIKKPED